MSSGVFIISQVLVFFLERLRSRQLAFWLFIGLALIFLFMFVVALLLAFLFVLFAALVTHGRAPFLKRLIC